MILHIARRCRLCDIYEQIIVATCDAEIAAVAEGDGFKTAITKASHERATDRVCEAVLNCDLNLGADDYIQMVQGDEILVTPQMLVAMRDAYRDIPADVVNLVSPLYSTEDHDDPNTVKVVVGKDNEVLYFSRAPIPSRSRMGSMVPAYQQTGVIGFRASFLPVFGRLAQTELERIESVDMLRVLGHGYRVRAVFCEKETIGVDTPSDLARAQQALEQDPTTSRYL